MTIEDRMNIQKGKESKYKATTGNIETALDGYILARVKNRRLILKEAAYEEMVTAASKDIAAAAADELANITKKYK